ncbi:MAG: NAD+ synthase [Actinomycetota bacterium]|nr:NAD+ synthase [Actinomycetota bacterium]
MTRLRVALCQLDPVVGDLEGNVSRVLNALQTAEAAGADMAVFPELAITGYPPEDLLLKPRFVEDNLEALEKLASRSGRCAAVVGFVDRDRDLHNAAAVCAHGSVQGRYHKRLLPNYGVFDEQRYFTAGAEPSTLFIIGGVRCGVSICEDAWSPTGPVADQAARGAEVVVNLNASPYHAGRVHERERMLATRAADASCALVYVNQVGGQDELVFDGASAVFDGSGRLVTRAAQFEEAVLVVDLDVRPTFRQRLLDPRGRSSAPLLPTITVTEHAAANEDHCRPEPASPLHLLDEVYEGLVVGTRDYVGKNGFSDVVVGLSGGIDSSLVAAVATDAVGAGHVHGVSMPSRFSSEESSADAAALADNLAIALRTIPIEAAHAALLDMLEPSFEGKPEDVTEENVQSRIRGLVLMALSNKHGWLLLATGNKSELAVGYSTLYGDTAGGFALLKDVPKTMVRRLCRRLNERADKEVVPEAVIAKAPTAELRADQSDEDSLPPYDVLDPILEGYVEGDLTAGELVEAGFDPEQVREVVLLVDRAEYKRRQSPPGVRVTPKAFGKDRRVPITNRYRS